MSPYRIAADVPEEPLPSGDGDLLPVFAFLWVVSAVRLFVGISRVEVFGIELALACAWTVLLPFLMVSSAGDLIRARRKRKPARRLDPRRGLYG